MPSRCVVPRCKGNYDNGPRVSTFQFPKDPTLRQKWVQNIKREGFTPTEASRVCELHFEESQIRRVMEAFDERTGKHLVAPLKRPLLITDAIPTKLPGCPQYLSATSSYRESPNTKKMKKDCDFIEKAIAESLVSSDNYTVERTFKNLEDAFDKINKYIKLKGWVVSKTLNYILFLYVEENPTPRVKCTLYLDQHFNLSLEGMGKVIPQIKLTDSKTLKFPVLVNCVNFLEDILVESQQFSLQLKSINLVENSIMAITDTLESMISELPDKQNEIEFFQEQIKLLAVVKKEALRYSWKTILFCSLLYSISPHGYKFLRSSKHLTLPCVSTIKQVCGKFKTDPQIEQSSASFLQYIRSKFNYLERKDKLVTLMMDEIHLKPYLDYKGGIVGHAYNSPDTATSAHVFMINSLMSPYKEVVHILPVKTLNAQALHNFIKKVILGLEEIGFEVIALVSDNNSINRKAMGYFSNPHQIMCEYTHPGDPERPLFFVIDPVHILKNLRNNWLNQKEQNMHYPDFETGILRIASFQALKDMHTKENNQLLKYGYTLSLKALYPTSIERQNVKLALQVINKNTVVALRELGPKINLENYESTADYIEILNRWWDIVNVKNPHKGQRLKDRFQEPITKNSHHLVDFLSKMLQWLQHWKEINGSGHLTKETHSALSQTIEAFLKISNYLLHNKDFNYVLLGQIQTDKLEERFGKYRFQSGCQYHVSVRQVFESESKLRIQSVLPLILKSQKYGNIDVSTEDIVLDFTNTNDDNLEETDISLDLRNGCQIIEDDISNIPENIWPSLVYISGYAAFTVLKHIKCAYCKVYLTEDSETQPNIQTELITANNRGGLCFPNQDVITCASFAYLILQGLLKNEEIFLRQKNQRHIVIKLTIDALESNEVDLFIGHDCGHQHMPKFLIYLIFKSITNILLKKIVHVA